MFDIGFWEIAIIGVIALIVIGPEKLPEVARNVGAWVGKGKRFIGSVQADINRELNRADELKKLLEEQKSIVENNEIISELKKTISIDGQTTDKAADNPKKIEPSTSTESKKSNSAGSDSIKTDSIKKNSIKKSAIKKSSIKKSSIKKASGKNDPKKKIPVKSPVKNSRKKSPTKKTSTQQNDQ